MSDGAAIEEEQIQLYLEGVKSVTVGPVEYSGGVGRASRSLTVRSAAGTLRVYLSAPDDQALALTASEPEAALTPRPTSPRK